MIRALIIAGLGLAVAACGLPRPFQPDDKGVAPRPQFDLGMRAAFVIVPIQGVPGRTGPRDLAELLAGALRERDMPAQTRAALPNTHILTGQVTEQPAPGGTFDLHFAWTAVSPEGATTRISDAASVDGLAWLEQDPAAMAVLARQLAEVLELQLTPEDIRQIPVLLYVASPADLPGDGEVALVEATRRSLERRGIDVVLDEADSTYQAVPTVEVRPLDRGQSQIVIVWEMRENGARLGQIDLGNAVPTDRLQGAWGILATLAGEGSADGLIQFLSRIGADL